jgi:predicted anti-sigma-YlaC factor YlaD
MPFAEVTRRKMDGTLQQEADRKIDEHLASCK